MERIFKELEILLSQDTYMTATDLGNQLKVSSRTIRNDIAQLNEELKEHGAIISTKARKGMILEIQDEEKFISYKQQVFNQSIVDKTIREQQLLEYLIMMDGAITIDELCDVFYVSRSTMKRDLKEVRKQLGKYDIHIDFRANQGMKLVGSENNLRRCLAHSKTHLFEYPTELFESIDLPAIKEVIEETIKKAQFHMSDDSLNNLVVHVAISIVRISSSNVVELQHVNQKKIEEDKDFAVTKEVIANIESLQQVKFPKEEIYYIFLHMSAKKIIEWHSNQNNTVVSDEVYQMVCSMLLEIYQVFKIDLRYDMELISLLGLHIVPFKVRLLNDLTSNNPLTDKIRSNYTLAYNMAVVACELLKNKYNKDINNDEIAYMALHFNVALEKRKHQVKENILIVCGSGRGTAELLSYKIKEKFGDYLHVVGTTGIFNLDDIDFNEIDYILTTITIDEVVPVPIIEVNSFLEAEDEETVSNAISENYFNDIAHYFKKELIFHCNMKEKFEVLTYLCEQSSQVVNLPENFLQAVLKREGMKNTAFGNAVAIPHPIRPMGEETFVTIGILDEPIIWDDEQVQLIFLLSVRESGDKNLQTFYKVLAKIISNKKYSHMLIHNTGFEDIQKTLKEIVLSIGS